MKFFPDHKLTPLVIGAIGVVYGDIGTNPLFTIKECFQPGCLPAAPQAILGVMSLIFWLLIVVVCLKYMSVIFRADNNGEGGILALSTLAHRTAKAKHKAFIVALGILGMALFYGDGVITPAISVLNALEGVNVATPYLNHLIVPMSVILLVLLFVLQRWGTGRIGEWFGPLMIVWFLVIGLLGLVQIMKEPSVLYALNPLYAFKFFGSYLKFSLVVLGFIVLIVAGAEALYADIGHFTKKSIRISWFALVWPSLVLNYFGQGALLLETPAAISNPFYLLVPTWGIYPMVLLATSATIIASQSVISGVFSITWQAIQLGYLPRMRVIHTSTNQRGRVYVPFANYIMLFLTVAAVLFFQESTHLATAYGLSVAGVMVITTLLTISLAFTDWGWSWIKITAIFGGLLLTDTILVGANLLKIIEGGWFSILIALVIYTIVDSWRRGRHMLAYDHHHELSLAEFIHFARNTSPARAPGVAVFMGDDPEKVPMAFHVHFKHTPVLHQTVFFLSIVTRTIPRVHSAERLKIIPLADGVYQVIAFYGFIESPNLRQILAKVYEQIPTFDIEQTTFFLTRNVPVFIKGSYLKHWREHLFIFLMNNAMSATRYFKIPYNRVVELGVRFRTFN
ncbi:potassium transporter Kup [Candidatus Finniella inopinata]|uniref:potassium transporter Kup n=1 Tax=Candidatus Finniella inopinata TaxID=1696036 RepID=UPI0013EECD0A|nr:KUP/HAK/KT family potassium transporter [Candidatus Finniella inopinata]